MANITEPAPVPGQDPDARSGAILHGADAGTASSNGRHLQAETLQADSDPDQELLQQLRETERAHETARTTETPAKLDKVLFGVTGALAVAFVLWGFFGRESLATSSQTALDWVMKNTGWMFVLLASFFVVYVLWLALGRFGNIPLGKDDEEPEFKTLSWISMMFAAGMGIGLMFYGVAEPVFHFISPPPGTVDGETPEAIRTAMATSIFHWGLHPWAMYAIVGIAMAYGTYRLGRKQLISSTFTSLFGRARVDGPLGKVLNVFAIFATLFGTAASLGLGALQIGSGLESTGWIGTVGTPILVAIVAILTACFVASAMSGISKGIQWLSNINMGLALLLAVIVFIAGPTLFILNVIPSAIADYAGNMAEMASRTEAVGDETMRDWLSGWTIFYWAWWLSWTPFVGMFIARISRGRTIRQFVTGVLLVPFVVTVLWFSIFGGAGIGAAQNAGPGEADALIASAGTDAALFELFAMLPLPNLIAAAVGILAMVLVGIFFITGADSASIVMGSLSSNGAEHPARGIIIFWGVLTGAVAAVMLMAGGDDPSLALGALQRITIVAALPFALVMLLMTVALAKDLARDPIALRRQLTKNVVERAIASGVDEHGGSTFDLATQEHDTTSQDAPAPASVPGAASQAAADFREPRRGADGGSLRPRR
ncbi:BCCT family transporter [Arthrobacter sp. zg-Y820]|uniref:BCCT family transporter n=1 Tax=unclassified Arthrobacter TaxID=235627 RepID=UPI001E42B4B0|nr:MULTISPECIES: BCCT family transporter [unclassified Arthrobacter]MCC9198433.1 BCCT family transporter [Arthrobacter sp. zg-Y820]MDK1281303.1 BCCT family transporter [Arthrobacter sp. zg.Y820]MDK1361798.1 BCCT family transporter [Arthrobacter sp. zg-Y1219]WIB09937.1 BCCT family transporter [Arthrobacter sp. zg-Y820]